MTSASDREPAVRDVALARAGERPTGTVRGRATPGPPASIGRDPLVPPEAAQDLAAFLASCYWPVGSHPQARGRGAVSADLRLLNARYGVWFHGLGPDAGDAAARRERLLRHVLAPSMLRGLYARYEEPFFQALARAAGEQTRLVAGTSRTLRPQEIAEMYGLYARRARGAAGAIRAWLRDPQAMEERFRRFLEADRALQELRALPATGSAAEQGANGVSGRRYQEAVVRREQARDHVAAALRRTGDTRGQDAENLVFLAGWLARRGAAHAPALQEAADILERMAGRLEREQRARAERP